MKKILIIKNNMDSKSPPLQCITNNYAAELLEFFESVGYDLDTPFELYTNKKDLLSNTSTSN